jgi:NADPH-dependent 2,4-dienoyl-CoA reductase/sulfur reductase-like enzyme
MPEEAGVVIIGGGQAAARAAMAMRGCRFDKPITIIGDEPHLPYERPLLSKSMLLHPDAPVPFVVSEQTLASANVRVRCGRRVAAIDRTRQDVILADRERAPYERLLIATGSRPRSLSIAGVAAEDILTLRTLDESRGLRARLANRPDLTVIGGGFIGLEVAATATALGCRVTLIEAAQQLLPRLCSLEVSAMVLAHHRAQGVDVRLGVTVQGGADGELILSDGSLVSARLILGGIGVTPATALAEAAGLGVDDGILVDEFGATSDPMIYAAGDVTRHFNPLLGRHIRLESWQNANVQAEAAGRTIAGVPTASAEIPWLWSDQGSLNLQVAGAPAGVDHVVVRGDQAGADGAAVMQFEGDRLVGAVTVNRGREMPLIRRLLAQPQLRLDPQLLADPAVPLRRFLVAREAA